MPEAVCGSLPYVDRHAMIRTFTEIQSSAYRGILADIAIAATFTVPSGELGPTNFQHATTNGLAHSCHHGDPRSHATHSENQSLAREERAGPYIPFSEIERRHCNSSTLCDKLANPHHEFRVR